MFIQVMKEQEQEKQQEAQPGTSGSSELPDSRNPHHEPGGGAKGLDESTTYYNTGYGPDENPNEGVAEEIRDTFGE